MSTPVLCSDIISQILALSLKTHPTTHVLEVAASYPHALRKFSIKNVSITEHKSKLNIKVNHGEDAEYPIEEFEEMVTQLAPFMDEATGATFSRINGFGKATRHNHPVTTLLKCCPRLKDIKISDSVVDRQMMSKVFSGRRGKVTFEKCTSTAVFSPAAVVAFLSESPNNGNTSAIERLVFADCGFWFMNDVLNWIKMTNVQVKFVCVKIDRRPETVFQQLARTTDNETAPDSLFQTLKHLDNACFEEKNGIDCAPKWEKLFSVLKALGNIDLTIRYEDKLKFTSMAMRVFAASSFNTSEEYVTAGRETDFTRFCAHRHPSKAFSVHMIL